MTLVKFKRPFGNLLRQDFFDMDDFFDSRLWKGGMMETDFWNGKTVEPAMNIKETDDHYEIELAAPGFSKKDFNVTIEDGYLNISAEKKQTETEKDEMFTRREFHYNAFERSMQLPENVKEEAIKARYHDGILSFNVLKRAEAEKKAPKVIEVG
ncbi:Hsp20/alpha crystallin family protein [Robiginitalea sp. M366]|uniref:Hsp20/alpha crystallin family protein n=1 Tax=Robiginitalea aestuariiviva TaxID=3036903 RepID=UPI00240D7BE0|nr:Hsp20/alpha crystallin family protein [Robiginitalea aestuariiviva]MDG1572047.1 Hsp20/alpha crystallin family protein [Robiginitalea aestuariiviva]